MKRGSRSVGAAKVIPIRERCTSPAARVGRIVDLLPDGTPRVLVEAGAEPVAARPLEPLDAAALRAAAAREAEVLLAFDGGDPARPIVTGILAPLPDPEVAGRPAAPVDPSPAARPPGGVPDGRPVVAWVDGQRVAIQGAQEIVLSCGKASITLRANGRIVIRGTDVETRAAGVNRVRGGTVRIN